MSVAESGDISREGYSQDDWQGHYDADDLKWDIGCVSPPLSRLFEEGVLTPGTLLIPGCGQGHEVVYFAQRGFGVTAVDYAPGAVSLLRKNLGDQGLKGQVIHQSFFDLDSTLNAQFDYQLEQTFFCAIHPDDRPRYVETAARILKPGGLLAGVFYNTGEEGGPPYNTTQEDIHRFFSNDFEVFRLEPCDHSIERRAGKELLAILKRK